MVKWHHLIIGLFTVGSAVTGLSTNGVNAAGLVVINEIMWDGTEYLELYNIGSEAINLAGWTLTRQQQAGEENIKLITTFDEEVAIEAGGFLLIEKNEAATDLPADVLASSLTLLQGGELVTLLNNAQQIIDQANALGEVWFAGANTSGEREGVAMERVAASGSGTVMTSWQSSTGNGGGRIGTPGAANTKPAPTPEPVVNNPPTATITGPTSVLVKTAVLFRTADAVDPDDDLLTFVWNFGDGSSGSGENAEHTYTTTGKFIVTLTVSDGEFEPEITHEITVNKPIYTENVRINEFLVNPTGSDTTTEFIELINTGDSEINLAGWQLDDVDGGSKPYTVPEPTIVAAGSFIAFSNSVTKIALNNTGDSVRLLDPDGLVKHSYTYNGAVAEGQSYNRDSDTFTLSTTLTPGKANVITTPKDDDEDQADDDDETPTPTPTGGGRVGGANIVALPLAKIRTAKAGQVVTTTGTISAPPGVLGDTMLYVAGSGIQIYLASGQWPQLALGDTVTVTGTLTSSLGEARLKLGAVTDIVKQKAGLPPEPHKVTTGEIGEALEGTLVSITGRVVKTSGDTFYIDDGSGEVKVFIKSATAIDKPRMQRGDAVTIIGIVSQTSTGYRVLPRFQEDVQIGSVAGLTRFPATGPSRLPWWHSDMGLAGSRRTGVLGVALMAGAALGISGYQRREPIFGLRH